MSELSINEVVKRLPENGFKISKTARKVGYSKDYSKSGIYRQVRDNKLFKDLYGEEAKKREVRKLNRQENELYKKGKYSVYINAKKLRFEACGWVKPDIVQGQSNITIIDRQQLTDTPNIDKDNGKEVAKNPNGVECSEREQAEPTATPPLSEGK